MASRAVRKQFRFRLVYEPELFVLYLSYFFQLPNPKDLADLTNKPKPFSLVLYALFVIASVGNSIIIYIYSIPIGQFFQVSIFYLFPVLNLLEINIFL